MVYIGLLQIPKSVGDGDKFGNMETSSMKVVAEKCCFCVGQTDLIRLK